MLRDDLEEILGHARSIGLRTVLNTKGLGLTRRPDLLRYPTSWCSASTAGPRVAGRTDWSALPWCAGDSRELDYALAVRRDTGTRVVLSAVATPDNLEQVTAVLEFARDHDLGFHVSPEIIGTQ